MGEFRFGHDPGEFEFRRREFLVRALGAGLFAAGGGLIGGSLSACGLYRTQRGVPEGQSIYQLSGEALINGAAADPTTLIRPGDHMITGPGAELIFVVGKDAFIVREDSEIELEAPVEQTPAAAQTGEAGAAQAGDGDDAAHGLREQVINGLRVISGKVLSVFGSRAGNEPLSLHTPIATIGIRGTGLYMESHADRTYVCTCYGSTVLSAIDDPRSTEHINSQHHDDPRLILPEGPPGERIRSAPVINHTDMELILIEELVGRVPPFKQDPRSRY